MPAEPPLDAPFEALAKCEARLLVIGGNAVAAHGSQRLTLDCDCAIVAADERLLAAALWTAGYVRGGHHGAFVRFEHLGRRRPVVDVMLLDCDTFEQLWAGSRPLTQRGFEFRMPKPLHLVAQKLFALNEVPDREWKDWPDIRLRLDLTPRDWTRAELLEIANSQASEGYRERLRRAGDLRRQLRN